MSYSKAEDVSVDENTNEICTYKTYKILFQQSLFSLTDTRKDIWLSGIISVSANSDNHLLWVIIFLIGIGKADDWIGWGHGEVSPGTRRQCA
jgi:hypothetical protein